MLITVALKSQYINNSPFLAHGSIQVTLLKQLDNFNNPPHSPGDTVSPLPEGSDPPLSKGNSPSLYQGVTSPTMALAPDLSSNPSTGE